MEFSVISPLYFNKLTDRNVKREEDLKYTVTVTPAGVEYSFPLVQEEVVRTLISEKEPIAFQAKRLKPDQAAKYAKQADKLLSKYPFLKYYGLGKTVLMNAVQDRQYSIEKRFLIMNFMMKTIQNMIDKDGEKEISPFVVSFMNHPDRNDIIENFREIRPNFAYSAMDGLSMLNSLPETPKFAKVRNAVFKRAGYAADRSDFGVKPFEDIKPEYIKIKRWFYEEYLRQGKEDSREYYIENVLVGFIWSMNLPYADFSLDIWDNFAFFNVLFNTLKVLLTLYVTEENGDDGFVEAVCALDESFRAVSNGLARTTVASLNDRGFNTNGDMAVLAMS